MSKFPLSTIRHSASHVLAQAVLQLFPEAKLGIGPAIEEGFYYDFELSRSLTPVDLEDLEKRMKKIIKENQSFKNYTLDADAAQKDLQANKQLYKLEIIKDLNIDSYSFYENGPFKDLCKGPHVRYTKQIGAIKLLRIAGAYWRGSEKNKMLQRIYGTAFHTKTDLDEYLQQIEEAKKRDHRVIGKALDLFSIDESVGSGLILWHPKGARIRNELETFWKDAHFKRGYDLLFTPHVGQAALWEKSGHLECYSENMFAAMKVENQDYYVRPMNCPFHIAVFARQPHSYRDLPLRYAELGTVYRYERSGVLHGLFRVRGFTQDDAHIICTKDQLHDEISAVMTFCIDMLKDLGFEQFKLFLSTRPKEKAVGDKKHWIEAENALKSAVDTLELPYEIDEGGGAFYGPKIDVKIKDAIGREWQCSTIQFDFNLPERFDMTYIGSDGQKHRPYMIHRALLGSIERFFGILIEHYEGRFPLWLAPVHIKLLTVTPAQESYVKSIEKILLEKGIRVEIDSSHEKIGYKIRQAATERVPYMGIIGQKEMDANNLSLRQRGKGDIGGSQIDDLIDRLFEEIDQKLYF